MRTNTYVFFTILPIIFCTPVRANSLLLEGVWVLNKMKTQHSIEESKAVIPVSQLTTLKNSYGNQAYVFKGNKTTYTSINSINSQEVWLEWEVQDETSDSITIQFNGLNNGSITFKKITNCLGLYIEHFKYIEYYCKMKVSN